MAIIKTQLPATSMLKTEDCDFTDSFRGSFADNNNAIGITEVGKSFFSSSPKWIDKLFVLRNKIVQLFGLKTAGDISDRQKLLDNFRCEVGEQLGLFKVFGKKENEVVLGEDDKHLNFRVSLFIDQSLAEDEQKQLTISTTVLFKNWFGRFYFSLIKPFHRLIVPAMLKAIIKDLEHSLTPQSAK